VFAFETSGRALNLEKGSVLFHSPPSKGGGEIKHGGASAAILSSTWWGRSWMTAVTM
jgi:hypothetical protein